MDTEGGLVVIHGDRIVRPSGGTVAEARFTACPMAEIARPGGWVTRLLGVRRALALGASMSDACPRPTRATLEGLAVIDDEHRAMQDHIVEWKKATGAA